MATLSLSSMFHGRKLTALFLTVSLLPSCTVPTSRFPYDSVARLALWVMYGHPPPPLTPRHPTMYKTTEEIVRYYGYPFETQRMTSEDGYITEVHRIPHSKFSKKPTKKEPILLVHGLLLDSSSYVMNGDINSIGFALSNAGYDVWMANNRGTRYSRKHESLLPDTQLEFWNFTFHEMGVYDLPVTVDYILSVTNRKQIYILGHSMGTNIISVYLSSRPSNMPKIKAAFFLAQALIMGNTRWILPRNWPCLTRQILATFHEMDLLPYSDTLQQFFGHMLHQHPVVYSELVHFVVGDATQFNGIEPMIDITRILSGASIKVMEHFLQIIAAKSFTHYDYGPKGNVKMYGQANPPKYAIENITVPVSIIYADDDTISVADDSILLNRVLKNALPMIQISLPHKTFEHQGMIMSPYLKTSVIDPILDELTILQDLPIDNSPSLDLLSCSLISLLITTAAVAIALLLKLELVDQAAQMACGRFDNNCPTTETSTVPTKQPRTPPPVDRSPTFKSPTEKVIPHTPHQQEENSTV